MTDTDTKTETDALQRLRDVRDRLEGEYDDDMENSELADALRADTNTARTYTSDSDAAIRDILTDAVDAWQAERDAQATPRTQGPVERALREEWEKYGHGAFKYDGCLLGKLLALDGSYKEFSSGCCTYAADAVGMLLDELGEPQPRADYNDRLATTYCPYCHGTEATVEMLLCESYNGGPQLWVDDEEHELEIYLSDIDLVYGRSINFCPMCGRRLTEGEQS